MIWTREVNTSIKKYVETLMENLTDHKGHKINVKTLFNKPKGELQVESYPSVTINLDSITEANAFNNHNSYKVEPIGGKLVYKKLEANKHSFNYTISFWTTNPIELDSMTKRWTLNTPKYSLIDVVDTDINTTFECKLIHFGGFSLGGIVSSLSGQTIFRYIITCSVIVGVDNNPSKQYTVVENVHSTKEDVVYE